VLLEVGYGGAPKADVVHAVPVETRVLDADPPHEVLLFVEQGLLESIDWCATAPEAAAEPTTR
jgi:hypothetical protein